MNARIKTLKEIMTSDMSTAPMKQKAYEELSDLQHDLVLVIIHEARMSSRPEFYAGRGATSSDLNCTMLETFHAGILREFGPEAAKQFVVMVDDLEELSATDFLIALYKLERMDWKWKCAAKPTGKDHVKLLNNARTDEEMHTTGSILAMGALGLFHCGYNDTGAIRGPFLQRHQNELPKKKRSRVAWDAHGWYYGYDDERYY